MIEVENLTRRYASNVAVDGISFSVSSREVVGFLGPNGAGKTTTLKVLTGCLYPSSGRISIAGRNVEDHPIECKKAVGYLPENNPLYEEMEVSEMLEWSAGINAVPASSRKAAVRSAVEKCGLSEVIGRDIGHLSKGYRQRVGLARAILHDPPILLLDEPTSGLDPNQAAGVRDLISELRREKTVLLSTHMLSEARSVCDRVIIINRGKIAAQGRPDELASAAAREQKITIVLRRGQDREQVRRALSSLRGAASVSCSAEADGDSFTVVSDQAAEDMRGEIFRTAAGLKWPLLELRRERITLEEVFRNLTL